MSLSPDRGLSPRELSRAQIGAETAIIINLSNGKNLAQVGMKAKGIPARPIQPVWWYLSSEPDPCTVTVDLLMKTHGSGAFASIFTGALAGLEPKITGPATENDGSAAGWPILTITEWVEARLAALTAGAPTQVSLTIHGVYV